MLNQKLTTVFDASELPVDVADETFDLSPQASPAKGLIARASALSQNTKISPITLLAAEHTTTHLIDLPKASARQQTAMMQFAVEELIGTPLDSVAVSNGPPPRKSVSGQLAFVTSKSVLDRNVGVSNLLPEILMIPTPHGETTWAVWREDDRAVVRTSDGTGFATPMTLLGTLWHNAGCPAMTRLADALPSEFAAADQSANPPAPIPTDLAFRFAHDRVRETQGLMRIVYMAGSAIFAAAIVHLAILAGETWALGRQADAARATAQTAIAATLPGIEVTNDVSGILARLAPSAATQRWGDFLPLLTDVSRIIASTPASTSTPASFRRLAWDAQTNQLVLLIQTGSLDDLQKIQQALRADGFAVITGAANAGEDGAEAEIRITRGTQQ